MIVYKIEQPHRHCSGGSSTPKPQFGPSADIIKSLSPQLTTATSNLLNPTADNAYAQLAAKRLTSQVGSAYGRAGLAGSGIAIQGETDALANLDAQLAQQSQQNVLGVLSAGAGSPTYAPQQQPRGLFGMK